RIRLDLVEEEAREAGKLRQPRDLLLHERRGPRDELGVPVVSVLAEPEEEPMRELLRRELAEIDAVHPVELWIVELRGTRAHAVERKALDKLVPGHDRRLAVGRPPEQGEEVHERFRQIPRGAKLLYASSAMPLRELLPIAAEDVRHVGVDRNLCADRLDDPDLLRGVRDVIFTADHMRDPIPDVLHRRGAVA